MVELTPASSSDGFVEYGPVFRSLYTLSAVLSIGGSLVVIITFLAFPQLRRFFARLVVYLAISDLWLCTSMLLGQSKAPHYTKCAVQSAFGTFFGLASILWTVAIADSVRRVLLARDLSVEAGYEARLHAFAWGLPCLALLAVLATGVAGPAGLMCWIRNTAVGTVVRFATFYVPLWLAIGYSLWVYWYVTAMMHRLLRQEQSNGGMDYEASVLEYQQDIERQRRSLQCMLLLPLILVFCWTPLTVRRLVDIFVPELGATPLDYLCVLAGPLQGALNALVYGATPAVRDAVLGRLDHSARKLRGVQARLRARRPRGRRFRRLDDDALPGLAPGPPAEPPAPAAPAAAGPGGAGGEAAPAGPPAAAPGSPRPRALGRPAEELEELEELAAPGAPPAAAGGEGRSGPEPGGASGAPPSPRGGEDSGAEEAGEALRGAAAAGEPRA